MTGDSFPPSTPARERQLYQPPMARLGASEHYTASPWAYNGKIFCLSEEGQTVVIPDRRPQARNRSQERSRRAVHGNAGDRARQPLHPHRVAALPDREQAISDASANRRATSRRVYPARSARIKPAASWPMRMKPLGFLSRGHTLANSLFETAITDGWCIRGLRSCSTMLMWSSANVLTRTRSPSFDERTDACVSAGHHASRSAGGRGGRQRSLPERRIVHREGSPLCRPSAESPCPDR